jgi:hypothetical protein
MAAYETLEKEILRLYSRSGFGRTLKSEIDAVVFHHFLKEKFPQNIDHYAVNKTQIFDFSNELKITQSRFKRLLEEDYLLYNEAKQEDVLSVLRAAVKERSITKESITKEGKIRLTVSNPMVKQLLDKKLYETGGILDFSFNKDILVIEIYDLLKLLDYTDTGAISQDIRSTILAKKRTKELSKDSQDFLNSLNEKTALGCLKDLARGGGALLLGKAGEELANIGFDIIASLIKNAAAKR